MIKVECPDDHVGRVSYELQRNLSHMGYLLHPDTMRALAVALSAEVMAELVCAFS